MGFFSRPLQRGEEPGRDGADAQTLHGLGSGSCLGGQAGLAEICQIHPEFPRRKKGDLQNSLLREPPDSAVSKARQIQPRRKTPPKDRLRQFVARCLENSRESICARATDLLPPLGEGVEEVGDRLEGFFQAGGVFSSFPGGCLGENNTARSSCARGRDRDGFFPLKAREAAGSCTKGEFMSWQRGRKVKR